MTTFTIGSRSIHHTPTARWVGVLLLSTALAFLAGQATAARRQPAPPAPPAAAVRSEAPSPEPPPWATHGFRDAESARDVCTTADCNG